MVPIASVEDFSRDVETVISLNDYNPFSRDILRHAKVYMLNHPVGIGPNG